MADYNFYRGGKGLKWPMTSTLATGAPGGSLGYSAHVARSHFTLPFWFDGGREEWHEAMLRGTPQGAGFSVNDTLVGVFGGGAITFNGAVIHLKKDLPSGIGLSFVIESLATEEGGTDDFVSKTVTLPAATKAGYVFVPATNDKTSFTPFGVKMSVTFTGASGVAAGQLLDVSGVCFEMRADVTNYSSTEGCSCEEKFCPADFPAATCIPDSTADISEFRPGEGAISDAPSSTASGSSSSSSGSSSTGSGSTGSGSTSTSSGGTASTGSSSTTTATGGGTATTGTGSTGSGGTTSGS